MESGIGQALLLNKRSKGLSQESLMQHPNETKVPLTRLNPNWILQVDTRGDQLSAIGRAYERLHDCSATKAPTSSDFPIALSVAWRFPSL